jgi:hypothetical protein
MWTDTQTDRQTDRHDLQDMFYFLACCQRVQKKPGNSARHWQYKEEEEEEGTEADRDVARMRLHAEKLRAAHKDAPQRKFVITQCWELVRKCGGNGCIYGLTLEVTYSTRIAKSKETEKFRERVFLVQMSSDDIRGHRIRKHSLFQPRVRGS